MIASFIKEFIFDLPGVTPACHAATVLPLPDGTVLAAWFGGTAEGAPDVRIWCAKRSADGVWSAPRAVTENDGVPRWNPVLLQREDGGIILYHKRGKKIPKWVTDAAVSTDGGETWSVPTPLVPGDNGGGRGPVKNKCLRLADGRLLAPASTEGGGGWVPFIDISDDDGATWRKAPAMARPKYRGAYVGLIQPTLWQDEDGTVFALMRSDRGALYRSESADRGESWTKPRRTRLPNNNSGVDCAADGSGRLWLLYNPVGKNWGARTPLALAVSTDKGKTFTNIFYPEISKGEYSYPAIVCKENTLYAAYTHNRRQIVFMKICLNG